MDYAGWAVMIVGVVASAAWALGYLLDQFAGLAPKAVRAVEAFHTVREAVRRPTSTRKR